MENYYGGLKGLQGIQGEQGEQGNKFQIIGIIDKEPKLEDLKDTNFEENSWIIYQEREEKKSIAYSKDEKDNICILDFSQTFPKFWGKEEDSAVNGDELFLTHGEKLGNGTLGLDIQQVEDSILEKIWQAFFRTLELYLAGRLTLDIESELYKAFDANNDGEVDKRDLLHLQKYLVDWDVEINKVTKDYVLKEANQLIFTVDEESILLPNNNDLVALKDYNHLRGEEKIINILEEEAV